MAEPLVNSRKAPAPSWMDTKLTEALAKTHLDYPRVALHAGRSLINEQVLAMRFIPDHKGQAPDDNTNLLEFARYASFLATLKADAGMTDPSIPPMLAAVEIVVRIAYSFVGTEFPVERVMHLIAHEEIGIMDITMSDRLAWDYATQAVAVLPQELLNVSPHDLLASEGFRVVFRHAQAFAQGGPLNAAQQRDLSEIAAQVLIGIGLNSVAAYQKGGQFATQERVLAKRDQAALNTLSDFDMRLAEELGVDLDRALALHDPNQLGH